MISAYTPSAEFPTYADYRRAKQRTHRAAWKARNAESYAESENVRRRAKYAADETHAGKLRTRALAPYYADPAKTKARNRAYIAANPEKIRTYFREYNWIKRRRMVHATPKWADLTEIREFYRSARAVGMEVDHIVPIAGEKVCGLHVRGNLQMLTRSANASKGNSHAS